MANYQKLWKGFQEYVENKIRAERAKAEEANANKDAVAEHVYWERQAVLQEVLNTMQAKARLEEESRRKPESSPERDRHLFRYPEDYSTFE